MSTLLTHKTTIKDIADAIGVSTSLVSFVMNNKAKRYRVSEEMTQKILKVASELNYQPNSAARSLRMGRTQTIGVIVSDISNPFFADIARHVEDHAYTYNYTVIFGSSDENAQKLEKLIDVMVNKGVDGLIIVPCDGSKKIIERLASTALPVVLLDRIVDTQEISHVVLNNRKAASMAVDHLVSNGYKNIEMISYDMNLSNIRERESGYSATMERHGLSKSAKIHKVKYHDIYTKTADIMAKIASGERKVDALLFATNTLTIEGLKAMNKSGMITPRDIAIVGFDGSEAFELFYTSLTYMRQPVKQFGYEAVQMLIRHIESEEGAPLSVITLNPELVAGKSSQKKTF